MKFDKMICPMCGEPARHVRMLMRCSMDITLVRGEYVFPSDKPQRASPVSVSAAPGEAGAQQTVLICGGGHRWTARNIGDSDGTA